MQAALQMYKDNIQWCNWFSLTSLAELCVLLVATITNNTTITAVSLSVFLQYEQQQVGFSWQLAVPLLRPSCSWAQDIFL